MRFRGVPSRNILYIMYFVHTVCTYIFWPSAFRFALSTWPRLKVSRYEQSSTAMRLTCLAITANAWARHFCARHGGQGDNGRQDCFRLSGLRDDSPPCVGAV